LKKCPIPQSHPSPRRFIPKFVTTA
jgi:hypothetical protein